MRNKRHSGIALLTTLLMLMLISSLLVGFMLLVMTDQKLGRINSERTASFYAAEAGMEKMTADLGTLFDTTYAPSRAQLNYITSTPPPLSGVSYVSPDGSSGYQLTYPKDNFGNPVAQNRTIISGPYQGLIALITPYTLTVTAHTISGAETKLRRTSQTVGIPAFQFGIFSQTDLSFFAGPNFNFGGRVHTNGNLFLAEGSASTLTMQDRVTAVGEAIRTNLSNGWLTSSNYTGTVNITTAPGTPAVRALASNEGSLVGTLGSALNEPKWTNLSIGSYNGNLRNGCTGAKPLNLAIVTLGSGTSPIDLIRRPQQFEDTTSPGVLGERYFAQASLRILLSDDPADITGLPCTDTTVAPLDLTTLAVPVGSLPAWYTAGIPLATSGAASSANYTSTDGYWIKKDKPIITGFIKIEIQTTYGYPCGTWKDVTREIFNLGIAGRNLYPLTSPAPPTLPALPAAQVGPSTCPDPSPNAVIRLQRVRDNPSNAGTVGGCGVSGATVPTLGSDYWPNVLFDPREGLGRDTVPAAPNNVRPTLGGGMHYVELDMNNLARWFTGAIGTSGPQAKDLNVAPNDFVVYFSDRRTNYTAAPIPGGIPAPSPTGKETGEYGFADFVNPSNTSGCPNGNLDSGEDLDSLGGTVQTYGQAPVLPANLLSGVTTTAITANPNCAVLLPSLTWPGWFVVNRQEARENPPLFFRRALKLVNGSSINLGSCPSGVNCGLSIVAENPAYVQGNFNAPGGTFTSAHVGAAVIADAFTFLSNNWNDINSFRSPYAPSGRNASTSWYRLAVAAGKGISFPRPTAYSTYRNFGTDGGVHNFLRFIENWSGQTLNYRGSIVSLYYNRQAVGVYKCCTTVYSPPSRGFNFDTDFLQPNLLPPRTPMFRDVNTTGFSQLIRPNQ
ncbi:MAG: hypothetical protein HY237_08150 [Acidobacteria bacterium]|nr:hypothetical protein [Acidobacteriota bacterium]